MLFLSLQSDVYCFPGTNFDLKFNDPIRLELNNLKTFFYLFVDVFRLFEDVSELLVALNGFLGQLKIILDLGL